MEETYIKASKCPMCGANVKHQARSCDYCGSTLIFVGKGETFKKIPDFSKIDSAIEKWRKILQKEPENAEANYVLGLAYLNKKLYDAALQHLRKAVILAPESAAIHYNLAITLFKEGETQLSSSESIELMKEIDYALQQDPNFSEAVAFKHCFLAMKIQSIDVKEAIKEYKIAIETCPDIAIFYNNLSVCYGAIKDNNNEEKYLLKAIELNPNSTVSNINVCNFYYNKQNYQEGVKYGRKALENLTSSTPEIYQAEAYNLLALCLWKTNKKQEAIENSKKALAICPDNTIYTKNLQIISGTTGCLSVMTICFLLIIVFIYLFTLG